MMMMMMMMMMVVVLWWWLKKDVFTNFMYFFLSSLCLTQRSRH